MSFALFVSVVFLLKTLLFPSEKGYMPMERCVLCICVLQIYHKSENFILNHVCGWVSVSFDRDWICFDR